MSYSVQMQFSGQLPQQQQQYVQGPQFPPSFCTPYPPQPPLSFAPQPSMMRGDYGVPQPPPNYQDLAQNSSMSLKKTLARLALNQQVEVRLKSNVFAVGFVISALKFFEKIAGWGYEISYRTSNGRSETDVFGADCVRPL